MADARQAIESANEDFMATYARGDTQRLAGHYTSDGMLLPAGSDVVEGRAAIARFWQGAIDTGIKGVELETLEVDPHGDSAVELGRYALSGADGSVLDRGKYIVVWKQQQEGTWQLHRDIWTTNGQTT